MWAYQGRLRVLTFKHVAQVVPDSGEWVYCWGERSQ